MAEIFKKVNYTLSLNEEEIETLWYHVGFAVTEEDDETKEPKNYAENVEKIYQLLRKITGK